MHLLPSAAYWPLRPLGLDPGRAMRNAHPTAAELQRSRAEQLAAICERFGPPTRVDVARVREARRRRG